MRKISGIIIIGLDMIKGDYFRMIPFGKPMSIDNFNIEHFFCNGMEPFKSIDQAKLALENKEKLPRCFSKFVLAKIKMMVAENLEELESFSRKKNLVVIMKYKHGSINVYGKRIDGRLCAMPLYGSELINNDFKPFTNFKIAKDACGEASRQGDLPATLATLYFKKL